MEQQIVIIDDDNERTTLMAQALRASGYSVKTLRGRSDRQLRADLKRLKPDFLVMGDEVVIDLKTEGDAMLLQELGIAC